jgi:glycosyltransferase involved in cell wall biosynthesis
MPTRKAYGYQISKMCEAFALNGLEVELWMPEKEGQGVEELFSYYGVKKNFRIKVIKGTDYLKYYPFLGKLSFWLKSIIFLFKLAFAKPEFGSVIFSRNPEIAWLFSLKGFKTVYEAHNWPKSKNFLHKFFLKKIDRLIVITGNLKELYVKNGILPEKIIVQPDAVDMEIFDIKMEKDAAREKLSLPKDKTILVYTGRFKTMGMEKGISDILKALAILKNKDLLFVAVGGLAEDKLFYEELARKLGVAENVIFFPYCEQKKLAVYQKSADIFLMPFPNKEHYAHYMSPLKLFEYMAAERPIIASDLPSIRDVLNEKNAILVEPSRPESLAEGISRTLKNPELAGSIARNAYEDVKKYTWVKRARRIIEFVNNRDNKNS